jgi:GNAT superfamily N-acetyltransferase
MIEHIKPGGKFMNPTYADLSAAKLAQLIEENLYKFLESLADAGGELNESPHLTRYSNATIISPMFNGVTRLHLPEDQADEVIAATIDWFASRGQPAAFWWIGPSSRPADMGARLVAHGLAAYEVDAPGMAVDLHGLPEAVSTPADFTIEEVRDEAGARAWADTFNAIYETPPWAGHAWADALLRLGPERSPHRLYLGRLGGTPIATNMLACAAGVASVLGVGTLPEARGQGIGAAVTLRPYLAARAMGYNIGVLFASEMGLPVYRRLGFREVGTISRYLWRAG